MKLATLVPERINSLTLAVTTPGGHFWQNLPSWKGLTSLARLIVTADYGAKAKIILPMLYPESWLEEFSEEDQKRTNWQVQTEGLLRRMAITRPQGLMGHISQMIAALTHHVTPERLAQISRTIPKVTIVTGDKDHLVDPRNSLLLKEHMPEAEYVQWRETGHALNAQHESRFNALLERTFMEGSERRL